MDCQKQIHNNIPALRFPDFLNDGEWEVKKFDDTFSFLPNNTLSRSELNYEKGIAQNIHYGDVLIKYGECVDVKKDELPFITDNSVAQKYLHAKLQNGDVVIADTAEDETVGKCSEVIGITNEFVVSGLHTIPIRPNNPFAQPYLGYYLNSESYRKQLRPLMQGVKVTSLSKSAISKTTIVCPKNIEEQRKIASCLSALDEMLSATNVKLEQLKAYKKGLIQKLFPAKGKTMPEIRFKEFEKEGGWETKKLGDVVKIRSGYAFKSTSYAQFGKYRIITISNVKNGYLDMTGNNYLETLPLDIQPHQILKRGDILISMTGNVGRVCIVDCDDCLLNQRVGLVDVDSTAINKDFLYTILTSNDFEQSMIYSGQGAAQANIGNKDIEGYGFSCPSNTEEQHKVASCFLLVDEAINAYTEKVVQLGQYKKGLMQQMFPTSK